ncbi:hypothetical protein FO519_003826 [Halicephalobus sp. NKZ332]|nr:hypothetical protein FO519_003826 [Halicephalobus sp. NKZ332]
MSKIIFIGLLVCWITVGPVRSCTPTQSYAYQGIPGLNGLNVNPGAIGNARSPIYGNPSLAGTVGNLGAANTLGTLGGVNPLNPLGTAGNFGRRRRSVENSFAQVEFGFGDLTDAVEAEKIFEASEAEYSKIIPESDPLYPFIFNEPHFFTVDEGKLKIVKLIPLKKHECQELGKILSTVTPANFQQVTVKC